MIADRDANVVFLSDRLSPAHPHLVEGLRDILAAHRVSLRVIQGTKDIWCRDYMPVQVGEGEFVQFRYDPDYLREHEHLITRPEDVGPIPDIEHCSASEVVLDGGNVVRWGRRCIVTDKVYRENPGVNRANLRVRLREALRVEDLIVIPQEPDDVIGHADGAVRFLGERLVVINDDSMIAPWYGERLRSILRRAGLEWVVLPYRPEDIIQDDIPSAVGCYANFLVVRGLVIVPTYGRDEDDAALLIIEANTSGMAVVPLDCTGLARGGGVLNCVTWTIVRDPSPSQATSLQGKSTRMTIEVESQRTLPEVACPICGDNLRPLPGKAVAPKTWLDCLRRCPRCELGYSNARANPTTLFGRPEMNVPEPVRDGVLAALDSAFNVRNRPNKKIEFGYSTSEDALTWTVFRHLVNSGQLTNALHRAGLPMPDDATHPEAVLLWGVPIPTDRADAERGRKLRGSLEAIANRLRENPRSRTEPDVVIDFGPKGLIIIEVKHRSGTDIKRADYSGWDRYYPSNGPLAYGDRLRTSGCYELARNWRFGLELTNAPPRPFTLGCLGPDDLFRGTGAEVLRPFEVCLPAAGAARFRTVGWNTLFDAIQDMPDWLVRYVEARGYSTPE